MVLSFLSCVLCTQTIYSPNNTRKTRLSNRLHTTCLLRYNMHNPLNVKIWSKQIGSKDHLGLYLAKTNKRDWVCHPHLHCSKVDITDWMNWRVAQLSKLMHARPNHVLLKWQHGADFCKIYLIELLRILRNKLGIKFILHIRSLKITWVRACSKNKFT